MENRNNVPGASSILSGAANPGTAGSVRQGSTEPLRDPRSRESR